MGSNDSSSSSRPLTGAERADAYNSGSYMIGLSTTPEAPYLGPHSFSAYQAPTLERLKNGDYNALEQSIVDSRTAPLNRAWDLERKTINQDMADRGLWSSGIPVQAMQKRFEEAYLPQFQQAGADAATQRYNLQANELAQMNQYAMDNAAKNYESKWRPLDYTAGIYNNTGGAISSSSGGGWSI